MMKGGNMGEERPKKARLRRCPECGGIVKVYATRQTAGRIRRYTRCMKCNMHTRTEERLPTRKTDGNNGNSSEIS